MDRESELKRNADKWPPIPKPAREKLKDGLEEVPTKTLPGRPKRTPQTGPSTEGRSDADTETR